MSRHDDAWDEHDDDAFTGKQMPIGEHIEDLRVHLLRALKGFAVALIVSFAIGGHVLEFVTAPVKEQLNAYQERQLAVIQVKLKEDPRLRQLNEPQVVEREVNIRELARKLGLPAPEEDWCRLPTRLRPGDEAVDLQKTWLAIREPSLKVFNVTEGVFVFMQVCLVTGLVLGSPWIFYQLWTFVAEGLYPNEKRLVHVFLPFSLGLFLAGIALCQFWVMPKAIEYLLWFDEWQGFEPDLRLSEWLGFAIFLPVVFGISFQTPVVMLCLHKVGLVPVEFYQGKRRMAWFLLAIFAALITPTPDPINMAFLWLPLGLLYELGIGLCLISPGGSAPGVPEQDRVEV